MLTGVTNGNNCMWLGWLTPDLFSIANTGFDESIELNGISRIEALKYVDFNLTEPSTLPSIQSCVQDLLSGIGTPTYDLTFTPATSLNHYVTYINWYDEEGNPQNKLDVLKHICQFYGLILTQHFVTQDITLRSYAKLWGLTSSPPDYSGVKHVGINETYSNTDKYLSGTIVDSILKPEDVMTNVENITAIENPYTYQIRSWIWKSGFHVNKVLRAWVTYEVRLHVLGQDAWGGGWEFPHYTGTGTPITQWWNPSAVI
jgi:hypothetical protein